ERAHFLAEAQVDAVFRVPLGGMREHRVGLRLAAQHALREARPVIRAVRVERPHDDLVLASCLAVSLDNLRGCQAAPDDRDHNPSFSIGSSTRKHVPSPGRERTPIVPPWDSAIAFEITSPSPVPGIACAVAVDERKKRWNRRSCSASGMPMPVSWISATTWPSTLKVRAVIVPPAGVNFTAFERRLPSSCAS